MRKLGDSLKACLRRKHDGKPAVSVDSQIVGSDANSNDLKKGGESQSQNPRKRESQPSPPMIAKHPDSLEVALKEIKSRNPWEEAYNKLYTEEPDLLKGYAQILLEWGAYKDDPGLGKEQQLQAMAQRQLETWDSEQFGLSFNGKDIIAREQMKKMVGIVLSVKDVVSAAISAEPHAALAWAGVLVVLPVLGNVLQQDSDAVSGFEHISTLLVRCRYIGNDSGFKEAMTSAESLNGVKLLSSIQDKLVDLYCQIYIYQIRLVKHFKRRKVARYGENLKDSLGDQSWSERLDSLKKTNEELDADLEVLTKGTIFQTGSKIETFSKRIDKLLEEQKRNIEQLTQQRDRILRALKYSAHAPFDSHSNSNKPRCLAETQIGPLKIIQDWCAGDGDMLLWFHGMAGTGKSTIARTVAWALHDGHWTNGDPIDPTTQLGGSFFFDQRDPTRNTTQNLFPTLAQCLAGDVPDLRPYIVDAIDKDARIEEKGLQEQWRSLISEPLRKLGNSLKRSWFLVIVIDSLDECEDKENIQTMLTLLASLHDLPSIRPRILITSRPETYIHNAFQGISSQICQSRPLDKIPQGSDDITRFIESELVRITKRNRIAGEWPGKESIEQLAVKSDGLFVYASTCCHFLDDPYNYASRLKAIFEDDGQVNTPQEQLDTIYSKIINVSLDGKTDSERQEMLEDFRLIVGTAMLLFKPISATTLGNLLFPLYEGSELRIRRIIEPLKSVLDGRTQNDPITPLHLSFRDFLLNRQRCKKSPELFINSEVLHFTLFQHSMKTMKRLKENMGHLLLPDSSPSDLSPDELADFPLALSYSCCYWIDHFIKMGSEKRKELLMEEHGVIHHFLQNKLLFWIEALSLTQELEAGIFRLYELQELVKAAKNDHLLRLVHDARRFLLQNRSIIEQAPLQVYTSALIFSPMESPVKNSHLPLAPAWIKQRPIMEDKWTKEIFAIECHTEKVKSLAFSPDGRMGASISSHDDHGLVVLWDAVTGRVKYQVEDATWLLGEQCIAFSRDGTLVAFPAKDGRLALWKFATGEYSFVGPAGKHLVEWISFSPDRDAVVFGTGLRDAEAWDTQFCGQICSFISPLPRLKEYQFQLRYLSNDRILVIGNEAGFTPNCYIFSAWVFDTAEARLRQVAQYEVPRLAKIALSEDKLQTAVLLHFDSTVQIWDLEMEFLGPSIALPPEIAKGHRWVGDFEMSMKGNRIAVNLRGGTISFWDYSTRQIITTIRSPESAFLMGCFSPRGEILATSEIKNTVRLWNIVPDHDVNQPIKPERQLIYPFGVEIIASSEEAQTVLRSLDTGRCRSYQRPFRSLELLPHGKMLGLWLSEKDVCVLDLGLEIQSPEIDRVREIISSPDGRMVGFLRYTSESKYDSEMLIWDAQMSKEVEIPHFEEFDAFNFSPDGRYICRNSRNSFELWDLKDMKSVLWRSYPVEKEMYSGLERPRGIFSFDPNVTFSPLGDSVAIFVQKGSNNAGLLEIWKLDPCSLEKSIPISTSEGKNLPIFSPDGSLIAIPLLTDDRKTFLLLIYEISTELTRGTVCTTTKDNSLPGDVHIEEVMAVSSDMIAVQSYHSLSDETSIAVIRFKTGELIHMFKTVLPIHALSFSEDERYLKFNRGEVPLPSQQFPRSSMSHRSLWVGEQWIFQGGRKLLWLPPVFRKCRATVHNGTIWLYHESGLISAMEIDLDNTPVAAGKVAEGEGLFDTLFDESCDRILDGNPDKAFRLI